MLLLLAYKMKGKTSKKKTPFDIWRGKSRIFYGQKFSTVRNFGVENWDIEKNEASLKSERKNWKIQVNEKSAKVYSQQMQTYAEQWFN